MERIAYLCLSEGWGGLEMNQLRNAQQMHLRGHSVLCIANANSPIAKEALAQNIPLYIVAQKAKHYQWRFAWKLCRYLNRENFTQLIFRNSREQSIAASLAFFSAGKIKVHYFMEMALGGKRTQFFRSLRYAFFESWVCPLPYLKHQVESNTKITISKVKEVPSGIEFKATASLNKETARKALGWPLGAAIFVVPGRIDPKKQQAFVWDAFSKREDPNELLVFVGAHTLDEANDYAVNLKATIDQHPKHTQVIWAGFQNNMEPVYIGADLVIMASHFETVGMATLEALQHGCVVAGANSGGSKEIIELFGGGRCFESQNVQDLNRCLDLLLDGDFPSLENTAFRQHFDFNRVCAQIEKDVLGLPAPNFQ